MKKNIVFILIAITLVFCLWLVLHQSKPAPQKVEPPPSPTQTTNVQALPQVPTTPTNRSNTLVRPASVDEETWNKWINYRQIVLDQNQPVEFYARVLDQNERPISGAKLKLKLTRWDENEFSMTNFPNWNPEKAVQENDFYLFSDANGWIQVAGTNGSFLNIWGLTKEGYLSSYPDGNFAGVHYEPGGVRTPTQDILMTNSWNPQKGYILHLQKVDGK
jgi:hypothetical protein